MIKKSAKHLTRHFSKENLTLPKGQQVYEKTLKFIIHKDMQKNYSKISHSCWEGYYRKPKNNSFGKDAEKLGFFYTLGENVKQLNK